MRDKTIRISGAKRVSFILAMALMGLWAIAPPGVLGTDPPHDALSCGDCHMLHSALGSSLTNSASNANLCQSCHNPVGDASAKALVNSMQALPGISGTSHAWDAPLVNAAYGAEIPQSPALLLRLENTIKGMASQDSINNTTVTNSFANYGLGSLAGKTIQFYTTGAGSSANLNQQRGVTGNTATTITWSPGLPANPLNYDRYAVVGSDARLSCSTCHSQHSQRMTPWDPVSNTTYTQGVANDRHMMRINNDYNQLCEDCHRSRVMTHAGGTAHDETLADGVRKFSHPVGDFLNSTGNDLAVPLDANGAAQTNSPSMPNRYAGDADGNSSNNLVLDRDGRVRCMTCHRMHYSDSNALSNDVAP